MTVTHLSGGDGAAACGEPARRLTTVRRFVTCPDCNGDAAPAALSTIREASTPWLACASAIGAANEADTTAEQVLILEALTSRLSIQRHGERSLSIPDVAGAAHRNQQRIIIAHLSEMLSSTPSGRDRADRIAITLGIREGERSTENYRDALLDLFGVKVPS